MTMIVVTPESPIIRSVFDRCDLDQGHFMWTGGTSKGGGKKDQPGHGYPSIWVPELKKSVRGHRLIFAAFYGIWDMPPGMHREHVCNRSLCLNPACMELVTAEENQRRKIWRDQAARSGWGVICPPCMDRYHPQCLGDTWCDCPH